MTQGGGGRTRGKDCNSSGASPPSPHPRRRNARGYGFSGLTLQPPFPLRPGYATPRPVKGYGINGIFPASAGPFHLILTSLTALTAWRCQYPYSTGGSFKWVNFLRPHPLSCGMYIVWTPKCPKNPYHFTRCA